ncbi:hypothetical protein JCM8202v2_003372 [Rhodotorula sphaerocarpa]
MVREAKGLALELRALVKRKEPWDRDLEFQRESLRNAYLRVIFSPARDPRTGDRSEGDASRSRTTAAGSGPASTSNRRLDTLNLLWLDTTHALISSYRTRLAELDKQIASAPKAHKNKNKDRNQIGNGGEVLPAAVGPVARRKVVHSFRQFLGKEEDFWRTLCGRFASRLYPEEAAELRTVGIIASAFLSSDHGSFAQNATAQNGQDAPAEGSERDALRADVLPLAHKALICFGDLARYSELYSETQAAPAADAGRGRGRGGKRGGGKGPAAADRRTKTYTRAAECYNQARLLLPDNGNPSNQLAVLAQYAADPLSSVYHYYRALCVRTPFVTAKANLRITFSKAVSRWFSPEGGEPDGDDGERFKAAFIVLHGMFFCKEKLSELPTLSLRMQDLFRTVISDRLLTSDAVVKVVATSLAALWDSRMSRSTLSRSKNGSTMVGGSSTNAGQAPAPETNRNLEPLVLLHVLSLLKILLARSTLETIELLGANEAQRVDANADAVPAAQNISAVLRRALPAVRILTRWLVSQLDYVSRVEARVEASERKRHRVSNGEEAQQPSLDSSASRESSDPTRLGLDQFRTAFAAVWLAYADFANVLQAAFPQSELPLHALDEGVWLEEDVELLGFVPLRRGMKGPDGEVGSVGSAREIRRVGRDVHPNDEQLMRVVDVLRGITELAQSITTGLRIENGTFLSVPLDAATNRGEGVAPAHMAEERLDDDEEMVDQFTEDDPVDRAMRVATASKLEMEGYSTDEDDAFDEEVLLLAGGPPPPPVTGPVASAPGSFTAPLARTSSHPAISNIWAPTTGGLSGSPLVGSSAFAPPGSTAPHAQPVTPHSFESIPNLTHGSSAAHAAGWPTAGLPPPGEFANALPPPPGGPMSPSEGAFAPIAAALSRPPGLSGAQYPHVSPPGLGRPVQHAPSSTRPALQAHASMPSPLASSPSEVPRLSTAFAGLQRQNSDLSPFAPSFGARVAGFGAGWGQQQQSPQQQQQARQQPDRSNGWG